MTRSLLGVAARAAASAGAALLLAGATLAQQLVISNPRGSIGPGPGDAVAGGPGDTTGRSAAPGPGLVDGSSWQRWWTFNRERQLVASRGPNVPLPGPVPLGAPPAISSPSRPAADVVYGTVVPGLLDLLDEHGRDNDVRAAVLLALGKIGAPAPGGPFDDVRERMVAALRAGLADRNESVREVALIGLGVLGEVRDAQGLAEVLKGSREGRALVGNTSLDRRLRAFTAYALGEVGARAHRPVERAFVVRQLLDLLEAEGDDAEIATAAVIELGRNPLPYAAEGPGLDDRPGRTRAIGALLAHLDGSDLDPRALAQVPVALARLVTAPCASDEETLAVREQQRLMVVSLLAHLATEKARSPARSVLAREGAVQALGLLVRAAVTNAPETAPDLVAIEALTDLGNTGQPREAGLSLIALGRIAPRIHGARPTDADAIVRSLLHLATAGDPGTRPWAAVALGVGLGPLAPRHPLRSPRLGVEEALVARIDSATTADERAAVAVALGLLGRREGAVERLIPRLNEGDFHIRGLIAVGLALGGDRRAVEPLREITGSPLYRPYLVRETATALMLLGDPWVADILAGKLVSARYMPERIAALQALAWSADGRAVGLLVDLLSTRRVGGRKVDQTSRAFAAAALGALCAREAAPWNAALAEDVVWTAAPPSLTDRTDGGGVLDLF